MFVRSMIGTLLLLVAFVPLVAGSLELRRGLLPGWSGPPGWLVQIVTILSACLVTVLVLGVLGWYSLVPTTIVLAGTGVVLHLLGSRLSREADEAPRHPPERLGRPANVVAIVAVSLVAATWGARAYTALSHGMVSIDSLWYHLPQAARFAHEHSILGIHHDVADLSGFYPVNAEILHSLGMVLLGNDTISMVLTLGWGVMALLAAWCIGRPHGMGSVCVTGVCVLLAAPAFVGTQPGAAHTDIVGVALVLSSAAILVSADPRRLSADPAVLAFAALPVGYAVGTKWTLLPICVALTIGVIVLVPRGRRLVSSAVWLGIVGFLGCFSYVRNLVEAGSPLPPVDLTIGPIGWERQVPEIAGMGAISDFLFDGDAWGTWFLPGLSTWYGIAWWAVLTVIGIGLILAIITGPGSLTRMLGCVGLAAAVGYVVQPQLLTLFERPYFFTANLRYTAMSMAFGVVLLPLSPVMAGRRLRWVAPVVFLALVVVMQLDPTIWPTELRDLRWENPVRGADVVAGVVLGVVVLVGGLSYVLFGRELRTRVRRRVGSGGASTPGPSDRASVRRTVLVAGVAGLVFVAAVAGQQWYLAHRYTRPDSPTPFLPAHSPSWEWARGQSGERIGVKGTNLFYPLYGNRQSNEVDIIGPAIGATGPDPGSPTRGESCEQFWREVGAGDFDYLVLYGALGVLGAEADVDVPSLDELVPEVGWLKEDPNVTSVYSTPFEAVFRVDGELDPDTCAGIS